MSRRTNRIVLVVVLVAFINLPLLHSAWTGWRVDRSGLEVTAEVVRSRVIDREGDPQYFLEIRFPRTVDEDQEVWPAGVDRATYEEATRQRTVQTRVLPDNPAAYEVEGQVTSRLGLVITVVADLILAGILLLAWRYGGRSRPWPIRIAAIADVERCPPGVAIEQVEGDLYLVRGEVTGIDGDEIVIDAGERDVLVILDGHLNPVGYQQPAQVRGRLVE
ncbi:MAG: hypothetical protein ACRDOM_03265 [Nocardioides sp.]